MDFNHYYTNDELEAVLQEWSRAFPGLVHVDKIGESFHHHPIWLLTLTNQASGPGNEKPALWLDGNLHATEIAGTTTVLYILSELLRLYGQDKNSTHLLDSSVVYAVPRINPDGASLAMAPNPHYIRSGARPYPWEDKDEGLHPQDIDGDGQILQMRIPDPNGDWKISSLDPRLMEKRLPEEQGGEYYRLLAEGLIEKYDGYLIKSARSYEGLDFNRNFPFQWRPEAEQYGAGPFPASEPETRALADFIVKHPNINAAVTYHTYSGVILRPYSTKSDDDMEADDLFVYKKIGERGTKLTGYRCVSTFHDFKYHPKEVTTGAFDDWLYDQFGAYVFTIELWDLPTKAGIENRKFIDWFRDHPHEDDLKILQWTDANAGSGAYVDWRAFDHPQLGKVELGGYNGMYTWRNPPPAFMGEEAQRNFPFVLALGNMLPHLSIHTLKTTPLGNGDYHLNLVVENTGFLPSYTSAQGKRRQVIRPVRVELQLPDGVKLLTGKVRTEIGHLEGRSNKLDVTAQGSESPTDNRQRIEWMLHVDSLSPVEIGIDIRSERAGSLHQTVTLEQ